MTPPVSGPNVKLRANGAWSAHVTLAERSVVIGRKLSSSYNGSWTTRVSVSDLRSFLRNWFMVVCSLIRLLEHSTAVSNGEATEAIA